MKRHRRQPCPAFFSFKITFLLMWHLCPGEATAASKRRLRGRGTRPELPHGAVSMRVKGTGREPPGSVSLLLGRGPALNPGGREGRWGRGRGRAQ